MSQFTWRKSIWQATHDNDMLNQRLRICFIMDNQLKVWLLLPREATRRPRLPRNPNHTIFSRGIQTIQSFLKLNHATSYISRVSWIRPSASRGIKTIPSQRLPRDQIIPSQLLPRDQNHTISTSPEYQNHTILTSPEFENHTILTSPEYENHTILTSPEYHNHTILTSPEYENHTILTSHEYENHTILRSHKYENCTIRTSPKYENHTNWIYPKYLTHTLTHTIYKSPHS